MKNIKQKKILITNYFLFFILYFILCTCNNLQMKIVFIAIYHFLAL